jgi:hypothetical protein
MVWIPFSMSRTDFRVADRELILGRELTFDRKIFILNVFNIGPAVSNSGI